MLDSCILDFLHFNPAIQPCPNSLQERLLLIGVGLGTSKVCAEGEKFKKVKSNCLLRLPHCSDGKNLKNVTYK